MPWTTHVNSHMGQEQGSKDEMQDWGNLQSTGGKIG